MYYDGNIYVIAGLMPFIPDTLGKLTVSTKLSSRTGLASGAIQFFSFAAFSAVFSAIGFRHDNPSIPWIVLS